MALLHGASGCSTVCGCGIFLIILTRFFGIEKQKALRRDCTYNIEIILEMWVPGVYLHTVKHVLSAHLKIDTTKV